MVQQNIAIPGVRIAWEKSEHGLWRMYMASQVTFRWLSIDLFVPFHPMPSLNNLWILNASTFKEQSSFLGVIGSRKRNLLLNAFNR